jgi:TatD DNase family protein
MTRDVAEYMAVLKVSASMSWLATTENFATLFHIDPARLQSA